MKKQLLIIATLAVAVSGLLSSCKYRPLEDTAYETALIPVRIDWSLSGLTVNDMHRASVILFPQDEGEPLEYRLEGNLTYRTIDVPVGIYSVLVFNETKDPNDWERITLTGTDKYETFAAESVPDEYRGFYSRTDELLLIKHPEHLAAWSLDRFEVTLDMVEQTRSTRGLEEEVPDLTNIKPLPRIELMRITAKVKNLSSSMQVTGTINGMASAVYLASGKKKGVSAVHTFILNGRVYDDNGKDGTTSRTFYLFGPESSPTTHQLSLDFLLNDGTLHPNQTFNVTDMIAYLPETIVPTSEINVGYSLEDNDRPIELPDMDVNTGVTVDDWDEVIIPVK